MAYCPDGTQSVPSSSATWTPATTGGSIFHVLPSSPSLSCFLRRWNACCEAPNSSKENVGSDRSRGGDAIGSLQITSLSSSCARRIPTPIFVASASRQSVAVNRKRCPGSMVRVSIPFPHHPMLLLSAHSPLERHWLV